MSSLSATQSDGYYIPPSYLTSGKYKHQSLNQFVESKGHNQYAQRSVVRFELPYHGFCTECNAHVGRGTRFNAHKAEVGAYYTSKVYEFTMKCRACAQCTFRIRNNPREFGFDYVEGIRKRSDQQDDQENQPVDGGEKWGGGGEVLVDDSHGARNGVGAESTTPTGEAGGGNDKDNNDDHPITILEKQAAGERLALTEHDAMKTLLQANAKTMFDDAASNAELRSAFRTERRAKRKRLADAASAGLGRGIQLYQLSNQDHRIAHQIFTENQGIREEQNSRVREKQTFRNIRGGSIFDPSGVKRPSELTMKKTRKLSRGGSSSHGYNLRRSAQPPLPGMTVTTSSSVAKPVAEATTVEDGSRPKSKKVVVSTVTFIVPSRKRGNEESHHDRNKSDVCASTTDSLDSSIGDNNEKTFLISSDGTEDDAASTCRRSSSNSAERSFIQTDPTVQNNKEDIPSSLSALVAYDSDSD